MYTVENFKSKKALKIRKRIRIAIRKWWECRTKRCTYFAHYLAYGPAELTHIGYHSAERLGSAHFASCHYNGPGTCSICSACLQESL